MKIDKTLLEALSRAHLAETPIKRKTDLDRLHRVVSQRPTGVRGAGRTFASCHHLAGILETCEEKAVIVWPLPRMDWLDHIRPMLSEVLEEHGLPFTWKGRDLLVSGSKHVYFRAAVRGRIDTRGANYVVDTYDETEEAIWRDRFYRDAPRFERDDERPEPPTFRFSL
ncbi:MAG: hypothetical protein KJ077_10695 [Anaerolineae bacterium]|nr:hypothetical protein [Anaerolineae bacterium]